jgi:ADP-ribose pyrophosphatase YjhB (NUDIX family)
MRIEVLHFEGCPNHESTIERVQEMLREEGVSAEVLDVNVRESSMAQELGFLGSPSVRIDGLDVEPEARAAREYGMMCRTYSSMDGPREGVPSREMLRKAIREANSAVILDRRVACDREEFAVRSNGGDWLTAWHPAAEVPMGTPHGANGLCVTGDGRVVLISNDAERWGWPGGRPEPDESWEQTLRREILEEACCIARGARLLGFCRSECLSGPEKGLVLVRSVWRVEVDLMPWEPRFEVAHRRVVSADELLANLWMEHGFEPIYHRALREASLM